MSETLTPMMRQYHAVRQDLPPNTLLLFRLGDFYEMFFEDAQEASRLLNVALTRRGSTPMCGVPYHSARGYIKRLIRAGKKVAICDQVGEVQQGKLVRREITQILSAGSLDDFGLEARSPNYLAAIHHRKQRYGLAFVDLSTGAFRLTELDTKEALYDELARISPAEILSPTALESELTGTEHISYLENDLFEFEPASHGLREHFGVQSLDGYGCSNLPIAIGAAGALLHYLTRQLRRDISHFKRLHPYSLSDHLILDAVTQNHLELVRSRSGRDGSLLAIMDRTITPMGARLLQEWILHPLLDPIAIEARQDAVESFVCNPQVLWQLREHLASVYDLERCAARLSLGSGNARDLVALKTSLEKVPELIAQLNQASPALLKQLQAELDPLPDLTTELDTALREDPPNTTKEGGMIREGYYSELDALLNASRDGKTWIAELQAKEIERTGIKSLKIRFTGVFGYFIEVTKANLSSVPIDYVRKQTTANSERFVTPELKEMENKILGADEKAKALEFEIFCQLRDRVRTSITAIQKTARAIAVIDTLAAFAETARLFNYCRPIVDTSSILQIKDGRHPVVEQLSTAERFVPNDTDIHGNTHRLGIITGPNMAGKSTYIRQVALIAILAQVGSFVPAREAHIGIADRVFTRVGASDDLTKGQSTFMVEMNETANILNNATERSIVILDEIGRGTSTFDGLSIAWSVAEFLHDSIRSRTLFATHYHELTDLARTRDGVINFNVAVKEWQGTVIFLRKILPGPADQSYGIHVAKLAGLPETVLTRAKQILKNLEKSELNAEGKPALAAGARRRSAAIINHPELELS